MKNRVLITNAQIVMPDRIIPQGQLIVEEGCIDKINRRSENRGADMGDIIDAEGSYLLPGFIDIHSDAIEKEIEPRPGAYFDPDLAFVELEKKLAGQGITTMFHSFSLAGAEWGVREDANAAWIIRRIVDASRHRTMIRNKVHIRFEITNFPGVDTVKELLEDGMASLLSFMDHTPGQGQYPTVDDYRRYMEKTYHLPFAQIEQVLAAKEKGRRMSPATIEKLRQAAVANQIPMASHDDDSPAKVAFYQERGVTINEFPVHLEAVLCARRLGNDVCVGAPNIVRNGSTGKAMRALDAILEGNANLICSDYYPPALLHAVFKLGTEHLSLCEAVSMASLNPARAAGLSGLGSLEEGKQADLIIVNTRGGRPVVTHTIVDGVLVYAVNYRVKQDEAREQSA
jgi:alpha-D-ribose 1-methylphosphonate 5-triphosphate diphosphatase